MEYAGLRLLVDPMFAESRAYRSLTVGPSSSRNPTVPLPFPIENFLRPDFIIATHRHFDHFDSVAATRLPKDTPLLCQPEDRSFFARNGFRSLHPVSSPVLLRGVEFQRMEGSHGKGWIRPLMGAVSGFLLRSDQEQPLLIAGDTVWTKAFETALRRHSPKIVILYAGGVRFNIGAPITMDADDVLCVRRAIPNATLIVVHMEAVNHCRLRRAELRTALAQCGAERVLIPADGEIIAA